MDGTVELEMSGLPKLYILPAKEKGMPYRYYFGEATAANFLNYIAKNAQNDLKVIQKKTLSSLSSFGATAEDDKAFYDQLEKEGLCHLETKTRSFTNGGFIIADKSEMLVPKDKEAVEEKKLEPEKPVVDETVEKVEAFEEL